MVIPHWSVDLHVLPARLPSPLLGAFLVGYFGYYMPYKDHIEGARLEWLYRDAFRRYAVAFPRLHAYVPLVADQSEQMTWTAVRFSDNQEIGTALAVTLGVLALVARWALL